LGEVLFESVFVWRTGVWEAWVKVAIGVVPTVGQGLRCRLCGRMGGVCGVLWGLKKLLNTKNLPISC
jgi:hypothetical protein